MNTEIKDFISEIAEFNDCTFCKKFGFDRSCPVKGAYDNLKDEPDAEYIEKNAKLCKSHVFNSLTSLL